jgi:hypothetical protein
MVRQGVGQKLLTGTPLPMPLFLSTRAQKIIKIEKWQNTKTAKVKNFLQMLT